MSKAEFCENISSQVLFEVRKHPEISEVGFKKALDLITNGINTLDIGPNEWQFVTGCIWQAIKHQQLKENEWGS